MPNSGLAREALAGKGCLCQGISSCAISSAAPTGFSAVSTHKNHASGNKNISFLSVEPFSLSPALPNND